MVIVRLTVADGPLQPLAETRILTEPENPLVQVTRLVPIVVVLDRVPAAGLLKLQLYPEAKAAVVLYVVVVVLFRIWQVGSVPVTVIAEWVPTVSDMVTVVEAEAEQPLRPVTVTV